MTPEQLQIRFSQIAQSFADGAITEMDCHVAIDTAMQDYYSSGSFPVVHGYPTD